MSSPISGGGDLSHLYALQQAQAAGETTGTADPTILAKTSDSISSSGPVTQATKQYTEDAGSPQLYPYDPGAANAADANLQNLQNQANSLSGEQMQSFLAGLSPELQHALLTDSDDPGVQQLEGQLGAQSKMAALASIGLEATPELPGLQFNPNNSVPPPGPIDPSASANAKGAQLFSNTMQSTQNAQQIIGAAAKGVPGGDSVMAFLKAISDAIGNLKSFLASMQDGMIKGKWGHDISTLADWNWMAAQQQKAQENAQSSSGGGLGGLFDGITDTLNGLGLGVVNNVINSVIGVFGSFLSILFRGVFGNEPGDNPLGDLLSKNIPFVSDMLKAIASMTKGIPFVGDLTQALADKPMLGLLALGGALLIALPLVMLLGPAALLLFVAAAAIIFAIGDAASKGGSTEGGLFDMGDNKSMGGMNFDIPIVGDLLKNGMSSLSGLPLIGDIIKTLQDNPLLAATVGVLAIAAATMLFGPFGFMMASLAVLFLMSAGGMGGEGQIPIIGDLIGDNGIFGSGQGAEKQEGKDNKVQEANRQQGQAVAASHAAKAAIAKTDDKSKDSNEDMQEIVALIMQLIVQLTQIQSALQGGSQGTVSSGQVPMDQLMGVLNQLNATGMSSMGGSLGQLATVMKKAQTEGESGDAMAMLNELTKGLGDLGADPKKLGAASNYINSEMGTDKPDDNEVPHLGSHQAA